MDVYLRKQRIRLDPAASIGKGGEADVFAHGKGEALKVWKGPDHPDYAGLPQEQEGARRRIELHQTKMRAFPKALPAHVVAPDALLTDRAEKRVLGFSMPLVSGAEVLLRLSEPSARKNGLAIAGLTAALVDLHRTVASLHASSVVIGDFNDLNVLVRGSEAFLLDADSFQLAGFPCSVFTDRFVDPLLCDPAGARPMLVRPFDADSDWYAFAVMTMQALLCVGPYGGVFKPQDPARRVLQAARPLRRVTVFDPEVVYPKPAMPLASLPDDLLHEYHLRFQEDRRGPFPAKLLASLAWKRCAACHLEHARSACPVCVKSAPLAVRAVTVVRGSVVATTLFETGGAIVAAAVEHGQLRWLAHDEGSFRREDGAVVLEGALDPFTTFAIQGSSTLVARGAMGFAFTGGEVERFGVDACQGRPALATNAGARYWARGGKLMKRRGGGNASKSVSALVLAEEERVGDVLAGQTRLWVGERFGLGYYRAGAVSVGFVFHADRLGLDDSVKLPFPAGEIVGAECFFDDARAWLFFATQESGAIENRCVVVGRDGAVHAEARAPAGDGSWLGSLAGKHAAHGFLLAPTDAGIARVEVKNGALVETRSFPDTEPFVDQASRLFAGKEGLYVVDSNRIRALRMT